MIKQNNSYKLYFNSCIITQIYSQLSGSTTDFYGIILGKTKTISDVKASDLSSKVEQKSLTIIVEDVIFIYDKNYLKEKLDKLLEKVIKKYSKDSIIGVLGARSHSYPNISLKEQQFYLKTKAALTDSKSNKDNIPLLFGSFCNNTSKRSFSKEGINKISFSSRVFYLDEKRRNFASLNYEIINMKDSNYTTQINHFASKTKIKIENSSNDLQVRKIKGFITDNIEEIENIQQKVLIDFKTQLKNEIETYKKLSERLKNFKS